MNPISKMMMSFMKQKIPYAYKNNDFKAYTKLLFSTYLFYFMFNSKKLNINKIRQFKF